MAAYTSSRRIGSLWAWVTSRVSQGANRDGPVSRLQSSPRTFRPHVLASLPAPFHSTRCLASLLPVPRHRSLSFLACVALSVAALASACGGGGGANVGAEIHTTCAEWLRDGADSGPFKLADPTHDAWVDVHGSSALDDCDAALATNEPTNWNMTLRVIRLKISS